MEITRQIVFTGAVTGLTYGVMAVGLVLIFRSSRVVNIAHAEIGAFGAALLALLAIKWDVPYVVALLAGLAAGALLGAVIEFTVVRRLAASARVILFVATMGAAQVVFLISVSLPRVATVADFPAPFENRWELLGIRIRADHLLVLIVVPIVTIALAWFLERTKYGTAIRASADNADAARMSAISTKKMSAIVWTLAGLLSAITAVLVAPLKGGGTAIEAAALGPGLLLRALAAALVARMRSLPVALGAGAVIGVAEAVTLWNYFDQPGLIDAALFVVVLVAVLSFVRREAGDDRAQSMSFAPRTRPVPPQLQAFWWVRRLPQIVVTVALLVAVVLPFVVTRPSRHFLYSTMLLLAIVGMSLTLLTGWAGQLSLGQFAFAGVGAFVTTALVRGLEFQWWVFDVEIPVVSFEWALVLAAVVCLVVAVIVGLPALRVRGLFLAITTLAFAVMAENWLFRRDALTGGDSIVRLPRARWGDSFDLVSQRTYYFVCLGVLCACALLLSKVRASGVGRSLIAVRDNEQNAAAYTVSPARMKLLAFAMAGDARRAGGWPLGRAASPIRGRGVRARRVSPGGGHRRDRRSFLDLGRGAGCAVGGRPARVVRGHRPDPAADLGRGAAHLVDVSPRRPHPGGLLAAGRHLRRGGPQAPRTSGGSGGRPHSGAGGHSRGRRRRRRRPGNATGERVVRRCAGGVGRRSGGSSR